MIRNGFYPCLTAIAKKMQHPIRTKWFFSLLIVALFSVAATPPPAPQGSADEQYIQIMNLIDKADALRVSGKADAAKAKYREAAGALTTFKRANPLFAPKTVAFRLNEVTERIEAYNRPPASAAPKTSPGAKPAPIKPAATKLEADSSSAGAKSGVKLLDPGAEPRKALRLHPKAGDKQTAILTAKIKMDMPGAPQGAKVPKLPALSIPLDATVQSVAQNGDITFEAVLGEAGVTEEPGIDTNMVKGIKGALAGLKGLSVDGVVSSRGVYKKVEVKAPPGGDPKMQQELDKANVQAKEFLSNIRSHIPEEPVGVGAKWQVEAPSKFQGVSTDTSTTYQLVSMDGDHVTTSFTLDQTAGNQTVQNAGSPVPMTLLNLKANGNGTVVSDLSKFVPTQMTMNFHMEMNSEVNAGNKKQPINMKMDMNFSLDAR
jgi:hypothetical protein